MCVKFTFTGRPTSSSFSQSIPKGKSPGIFNFMRLLPSSLTSRKSLTSSEEIVVTNRNVPTVYAATSVTPTSSDGGTATSNTHVFLSDNSFCDLIFYEEFLFINNNVLLLNCYFQILNLNQISRF